MDDDKQFGGSMGGQHKESQPQGKSSGEMEPGPSGSSKSKSTSPAKGQISGSVGGLAGTTPPHSVQSAGAGPDLPARPAPAGKSRGCLGCLTIPLALAGLAVWMVSR